MKKLQKASETLKSEGIELAMKKLDIADKDVIARYGNDKGIHWIGKERLE